MCQSFSGRLTLKEELSRIFGNIFNTGDSAKNKADKQYARRGVNKVLALAGLTLTGAAAIPATLVWEGQPLTRKATLSMGLGSLGAHVLYSVSEFYDASPSKLLAANAKGKKFEGTALVAG